MTQTIADCPTFIDLRAFAADARRAPSADPFGAGRSLVPLRAGPVEVGAIDLAEGSGTTALLSGDWWLYALAGEVALGGIRLAEGESLVAGHGTSLEWMAPASARLLFMRYAATAGEPGLTPIDLAAELAPSGAPLAELLIGETPVCRNHTDFRSADGTFSAGLWDSTPYHRSAMRYAHCELMVLLKGSVTFVDEAGREGTFRQGDILLVEQGASCSWESREDVAKVWAIWRPAT